METRKCGFLLAESSCQAAEMSEVRECKSKLREGEEGKERKEKGFRWLNGDTEMAQQFPRLTFPG
jgi:hypothetical protein